MHLSNKMTRLIRALDFDPKQRLMIIMMIQVPAPANSFYRRAVRDLAYQALSGSD
jgi:hypothetical protein